MILLVWNYFIIHNKSDLNNIIETIGLYLNNIINI